MRRLTGMMALSVLLMPAFGSAVTAQQVRSEKLLGGNENPPVISDGSGSFRMRIRADRLTFRLKYDVAAEEDMDSGEDMDSEEDMAAEEDMGSGDDMAAGEDMATEEDMAAEEEAVGVLSDITQAHLHIANPGNNGEIVVFLCSNLDNIPDGVTPRDCPLSPGEVTGDIVAADVLAVDGIIDADDLEGLVRLAREGSLYVNVHTDDHPTGEVRGQTSPRQR